MHRWHLLFFFAIVATAPVSAQTPGACPALASRSGALDARRPWHDSLETATAPGSALGMIVDLDDQPLAGTRIALRRLGQTTLLRTIYTDARGRFSLAPLPHGLLEIVVDRIGFLRQVHTIRAFAGSADTLCVRLRALPFKAPTLPDTTHPAAVQHALQQTAALLCARSARTISLGGS